VTETPDSWLIRMMNRAINKLISYDTTAAKKLSKLSGKAIRVVIEPIQLSFELVITGEAIQVSQDASRDVDTTISGKPSALFAMGTNQHVPGLDGVQIQGDASSGQYVVDFLKQLQPDWEDAWCDLLGEGPGYQVSQFLQSVKHNGSQLLNSLRRNTREFLLEENRELISNEEMDDFLDAVDDLQADLSRLEQRMAQLKARS
jgi:ubiquinone biosynthesis protein UbiJ